MSETSSKKKKSSKHSHKDKKGRDIVKKHKKDPLAPKRPRTAFLLFSVDKRESVIQAQPNLVFGDIAKEVSVLWKNCRESERQKYNNLANEDKQRYEREMEEYKAQQREKEEKRKMKKKNKSKKEKSKKKKKKHESSDESSSDDDDDDDDQGSDSD